MKKKLQCYCDNIMDFDLPESLELTIELSKSIIDGSFLNVKCGSCGAVVKPEFPLLLKDTPRNFSLFYLPENQRDSYLSGNKEIARTDRVVIGYLELVEKVKLLLSELDDRVIELIKFFYLEKAPAESNISLYFQENKSGSLIFHLYGLREDEVGILKIEKSFYDKLFSGIESKVISAPFCEFLSPPYISIKKISIEGGEN